MADYYSMFSEVEGFEDYSPEDKLAFGNEYAGALIDADKRFKGDPEVAEFLRDEIKTSLLEGLKSKGVNYEPPVPTFAEESAQGAEGLFADIDKASKRFREGTAETLRTMEGQTAEENLGMVADEAGKVLLHTAGIPGRALSNLAEFPNWVAAKGLETFGGKDTAAWSWFDNNVKQAEADQETMNVYKSNLANELGIVAAGATGGITAAGLRALQVRALSGAVTKMMPTVGMSVQDAAIIGTATAAAGEAAITPVQHAANSYIDASGYPEEYKKVLKVATPLLLGVGSAATIEMRMAKKLGDPTLVNAVVKGMQEGRTVEELAVELKDRLVEAPTTLDFVKAKTGGKVPMTSYEHVAEEMRYKGEALGEGVKVKTTETLLPEETSGSFTKSSSAEKLDAALEQARKNNTFTGQAPAAGRGVGVTQAPDTPVEKLFSNFAYSPKDTTPEAISRLRAEMFKRANKTPADYVEDTVTEATERLGDNSVRVEAAQSGNTRVTVINPAGEVIAAAGIRRGMLDSIAVLEAFKGGQLGRTLLEYIDRRGIGNIREVPDRSPGFVAIQKKALFSKPLPPEQVFSKEAVEANEAIGTVQRMLANAGEETDPAKATARFMSELSQAVEKNELTELDGLKVLGLKDQTVKSWLFAPSEAVDDVSKTLKAIGISGQSNDSLLKWSAARLNNEGGYITPDFIRTVGLHSIPLAAGFEHKDGQWKWNLNTYLKQGAPFNAALGGFQVYRAIGANKALTNVGNKFSKKFWDMTVSDPWGVGKALKPITHSLRPGGGLDAKALELRSAFKNLKSALPRDLENFVVQVNKNFTLDERRAISDFIEQEGDNWANIPQVLQDQAAKVVDYNAKVRAMLVESGVDEEMVNKLGDKWLHRVYIPNLAKKQTYKNLLPSMKGMVGNYLRTRGRMQDLKAVAEKASVGVEELKLKDKLYSFTDENLKSVYVHESQTDVLAAARKAYGDEGRLWTVIKERGKLVANSDYTKFERELLGEETDVSTRMAVFMREAAHDIALGKMFKDVADSELMLKVPAGAKPESLAKQAKELGYELMPNTITTSGLKKYGALNGQWVHPDVKQMLKEFTGTRYANEATELAMKMHRSALTAWKIGKVAFSPATMMVNFLTNVHMAPMNGYNPLTVLGEGVFTLASKDKYLREAIATGKLRESSIMHAEWDYKEFAKQTKGLKGTETDGPKLMTAAHSAAGLLKKTAMFPVKIYSGIDEVFKVGLYRKLRREGWTPDDAMDEANRVFFDYSDVPPGVRTLRDTGVMPFVSYIYKAIPSLANAAVNNPHRLLGMMLMYKTISDLSYKKQFDDKWEEQKDLERALRPSWQQKKLFGVSPFDANIRLKDDPKTGEARTIDVSKMIPGADLFSDTTDSAPFGLAPAISLLYTLQSHKDARTGRKMIPYDDPQSEVEEKANLKAKMKIIYNFLVPNNPGLPYTWANDKIGNALVASGDIKPGTWLGDYANEQGWSGKNYFGNNVDLGDTVASTAFGLKVSSMDVDQASFKEVKKFGYREKDAMRALRQEMKSQATTPARMDEAVKSYEQKVNKVNEEKETLYELLRNAR